MPPVSNIWVVFFGSRPHASRHPGDVSQIINTIELLRTELVMDEISGSMAGMALGRVPRWKMLGCKTTFKVYLSRSFTCSYWKKWRWSVDDLPVIFPKCQSCLRVLQTCGCLLTSPTARLRLVEGACTKAECVMSMEKICRRRRLEFDFSVVKWSQGLLQRDVWPPKLGIFVWVFNAACMGGKLG